MSNSDSDEIDPVPNTTADSELISLAMINENRSFGWVESPDYPKLTLHNTKIVFGNFMYFLSRNSRIQLLYLTLELYIKSTYF